MFKKMLMIGAMVAISGSAFADVIANSASGAVSDSKSASHSVAKGGDQSQGQGQGQGQAVDNKVGQGQGQSLSIDNHGVVEATDVPVASSASVFVQSCQYGASGQGQSAGISMGSDSAQCMNLRQAAIHMEQYERIAKLALAAPPGDGKVGLYKAANRELKLFQSYLDKADEAANAAHPTKMVGGAVTDILPIGILIGILSLI